MLGFRKSRSKNLPSAISAAQPHKPLAINIGSWLALLITVSTLTLTLLSYGHELGYSLQAGLQPEDLQHSPLDLLLRSWHLIFSIMKFTENMVDLQTLHRLYEKIVWSFWWLIFLAGFTALCACCYQYAVKNMVIKAKLAKFCAKLTWLDYLGKFFKNKFSVRKIREVFNPIRLWGYSGWLAIPAVFIIMTLAYAIVFMVIRGGFSIVGIIPVIGFDSGITRAQQQLINPIGCVNPKLKNGDDPERRARCMSVKRDGKEVGSGYLIDYGAGRIFLYQPCKKQPLSLPIDGSVIEQIDALDLSNPNHKCMLSAKKP
jgi:hypothetical protein